MRFLSPVLSPFILAFLFAGYMSKLTKKLPFKMKKPILAGILLLLFVIFCLIAAGFIGGLAVQKCKQIADSFPFYEAAICGLLGTCCDFMENSFGIDGNSVENYVIEQVNIFAENIKSFFGNISFGGIKSVIGYGGSDTACGRIFLI